LLVGVGHTDRLDESQPAFALDVHDCNGCRQARSGGHVMGAERPVAFYSGATPMQVCRCGTLPNQTVAKYLRISARLSNTTRATI
jgi:hypothetical protein